MLWREMSTAWTRAFLLGLVVVTAAVAAEESRFAMTHSRSEYVHWIDLYDADGRRIDPSDPDALPYSPVHTCGRCHDYEAIAHGYHFNAMAALKEGSGRPGEPWLWTDSRTGTQLPLSYRGWTGTYDPRDLGITRWDFLLKFGSHLPGGIALPVVSESADDEVSARDSEVEADPGAAAEERLPTEPADNGRWPLSGPLAIDCMMCHGADKAYSPETWWGQVSKLNFAWAPAAALGLADVEGSVTELPDDFDPQAKPADESEEATESSKKGPRLPRTTYRPVRIDGDKKIFFDVIRKPRNSVCYYCHTARVVGSGSTPQWTHDEDVHLRAGMSCTDCHRNGIEHHTVRAFEGESHPSGQKVATLSCRGCHMGQQVDAKHLHGGRLGAPKPLHKGLPPLHLERLACTTCHSGPRPSPQSPQALQLQTAMAHGLGLPTHDLKANTVPEIAAPVMLRTDGVLYPHRMVWPAFWGELKSGKITPHNPEEARAAIRKKVRVKRGQTFTETLSKVRLKAEDKIAALGDDRAKVPESELTDEEKKKLADLERSKGVEAFRSGLADALREFRKAIETEGAEPVYVAGGRVYRLGKDDVVEISSNKAADPYAWKLAHDVRPARWSSGATGCFECHSIGSPIFDGEVTALGPAVDAEPPTQKMAELAGYDRTQIDAWNMSFQGRTAFKWFAFISAGAVILILLAFFFLLVNGLFGIVRRA